MSAYTHFTLIERGHTGPELNARVKRLFLRYCWAPDQIQYRLRHGGSPQSSVTRPSTAPFTRAVSMTPTG